MSGWSEERIATAARLWREGHSASSIADQIGGVSRNAVLGLMNRTRGRFPLRGNAETLVSVPRGARPKGEEKPAAMRTTKPKAEKPAKPVRSSTPNFKPEKRSARLAGLGLRVHAPQPVPSRLFPHRGAALEGGAPEGIRFSDLTARQCAWPLTDFADPDGPDMPCCGLPVRGGETPDSSYCAAHAARSRGDA